MRDTVTGRRGCCGAPRITEVTKQVAATGLGFGWASTNWSGYAITENQKEYNRIAGEWIVPRVRRSSSRTYSSAWIGIDGFNNSSLIQTGTEHDYRNGQARYYAWWEILPDAPHRIPYRVAPGDRMRAEICRVGQQRWSIRLINCTRRWTYRTIQTYTGPRTSAEWIVEAPQVGGQVARLADYGKTCFDRCRVNGVNPRLMKKFGGVMIQNNVLVSTPSVPDRQRDGFAMAYGSRMPAPPSSGRRKTAGNEPNRPNRSVKPFFAAGKGPWHQ